MRAYFSELFAAFGDGWNQFWFRPRTAETLGLLRILVGLTALYVVATFAPDLATFFGPNGLLPKSMVDNWLETRAATLSPLWYCASTTELYVALALALIVLALFTAGVLTRVTSVLAWLAVLSFSHRGPLLTQLVEPLLALSTLYLCIGPCGRAFSVDAWRKRGAEKSPSAADCGCTSATISQRLLQLHTSAIYLLMGLGKLAAGDLWFNGEAVWRLAAKPESRLLDLTGWLHSHPFVYQGWSHAIVLFELVFAVLIWHRLARPLLLGLSVLHWAGLAVLTGDVPFCVLMCSLGLAFVPPESIRRMAGRRAAA